MRKAHLVVAALALAASMPASGRAETVHRHHARTHARRAAMPLRITAPPAGAGLVAPENPQLGSAIDQTSSSIARADAATRSITRDAFAPLLRMIYPPGNSGDL